MIRQNPWRKRQTRSRSEHKVRRGGLQSGLELKMTRRETRRRPEELPEGHLEGEGGEDRARGSSERHLKGD